MESHGSPSGKVVKQVMALLEKENFDIVVSDIILRHEDALTVFVSKRDEEER